ncbi:MAG TPA: hypothetical protein VF622_02720 [Segetibacter sp.]|jgi:hypothetical protein
MEPEMVEFLKKISKSILIAVVWLGITSIAAIKGDNAFVEGDIRLGNVIFYIWFVISIVIAIKLFKKVWINKDGEDA